MAQEAILSVNLGSSSLKFALYSIHEEQQTLDLLCKGKVDGLSQTSKFSATGHRGESLDTLEIDTKGDLSAILEFVFKWISQRFENIALKGVGHRVVHGGTFYAKAVLIDQTVLTQLDKLSPLAPYHQPQNLLGVRVLQELRPLIPQVACFDTAFHANLPHMETLFALPHSLWDEGVRRYGFHGLSYDYIADQLPSIVGETALGKIIVAHLGHGASLCALKDRQSVATTMGFSALEGLPMGTRCGCIDPGVLLYLAGEKGYSQQQLEDLLYLKSGLLGLSGISDDVRVLLATQEPLAREAIDYFSYQVHREMGSLIAILGGLDAVVFTAGIGENAAQVRAKICEHLSWLGVSLDSQLNGDLQKGVPVQISNSGSPISIWVIPTDEEFIIAKQTLAVVDLIRV